MSAERDRLRAAVASIGAACPFCDSSVAYVAWSWATSRYGVKVVHPCRTCPALTAGPYQDRADSYLTGLLELYGVRVAEYADDDLIAHDTR